MTVRRILPHTDIEFQNHLYDYFSSSSITFPDLKKKTTKQHDVYHHTHTRSYIPNTLVNINHFCSFLPPPLLFSFHGSRQNSLLKCANVGAPKNAVNFNCGGT